MLWLWSNKSIQTHIWITAPPTHDRTASGAARDALRKSHPQDRFHWASGEGGPIKTNLSRCFKWIRQISGTARAAAVTPFPQKAPNGQPHTRVPPYILCFLKQKCSVVVHFLAVFSHLQNLFFILSFQIFINTYFIMFNFSETNV